MKDRLCKILFTPKCCGAAMLYGFGPENPGQTFGWVRTDGEDWLDRIKAAVVEVSGDFIRSGLCRGLFVADRPDRLEPFTDVRTHLIAYLNDYQMGTLGSTFVEAGWVPITSFVNPKSGSNVAILELRRDAAGLSSDDDDGEDDGYDQD
jgi:hypothetical protein